MNVSLGSYQALVFDCDGVVFNSNKVKSKAFYGAALPYGEGVAQALVDYHVKNGGISRYLKFEYLLNRLVPSGATGPTMEELLTCYTNKVWHGLTACELATGLEELRQATINARWLIVSGGDQDELRKIFSQRGIAHLFDGGIFGSPDTKNEILSRELANANIANPALFIGDSRYDYYAANHAGLDFVFVSKWTEFDGWREFCSQKSICHTESISDLLNC